MWQHLLDLLRTARRPLVVLDFETSGLSGAPPVEFAVLVWAPWEAPQDDAVTVSSRARTPPGLTYAATMRLDPLRPIDPGAFRKHGIRDADVRGKPRWDDLEVRGFFRSYAEGDAVDAGGPVGPAIWCGHNAAGADVPWARRWGYLPSANVDLDVVDTMRMARRLAAHMPHPFMVDSIPSVGEDEWTRAWGHPLVPCIEDGLDCYAGSLVGVHKAVCGFRPPGSHGALADGEATARVLARMLDLWAPLFMPPTSLAGAPAAEQLAAVLAALDAPMPGEVAWDGWLAVEEQESVQGAMRFAPTPPRYTWRRGKYEGTPAHRDEWVLALPRAPTGDNAKSAWCSPKTAAILEGMR